MLLGQLPLGELPAVLLGASGGDDGLIGSIGTGPWWMALIPLLPMVGVVLMTLCAIFRIKSKLPAWITVGLLGTAFGIAVAMYQHVDANGPVVVSAFEWIHVSWGDGPGQALVADFAFYIDSLTCLWMLFVTGLATLIALYASEYMAHDVGVGYSRFFMAFNLFVFSMACLVMGENLLVLFLGWEGVGLCSYLLIGYFYKKPSAVAAAKKAFIVNRIGDFGLLLGIFLTFVKFGTLRYPELFPMLEPYLEMVKSGQYEEVPVVVGLIPVLLMIGAFGKSAQLPLYVWLPDAMEGPTPVSALIHAATMVTAGVYLVARMFPMFLLSEHALPIVGWIGALTALLSATIAMAQFDIKRIMAYSTISQLGYMFCGAAMLTTTGAAFHVLTHAFFKATLFLCCGAVMHGFAGQLDLRKLSGVSYMKGWGIVGIAMLVGCLNLSGFPFTAGFFSKDMIIAESFVTAGPGYTWIGWILLITAGLTAYYTFRVFFRVFVGPKYYEPGDEHHGAAEEEMLAHEEHEEEAAHHSHFHPHAPGWAINLVLVILSVAAIGAAGLNFVDKDEHGWVGHMVAASTANDHEAKAQALFIADEQTHAAPVGHENEHDAAPVEAHAQSGDMHTGEDHVAEDESHQAEHHGSFLGYPPHEVMFYVSSVFGLVGIGMAFVLHYAGRTSAAVAKADALVPLLGPIVGWAQHKWYVDEFYNAVIVLPLRVLAYVFGFLDRLLVDGLVNVAGAAPRFVGEKIRPWQNGVLHGYAIGMAGGLAVFVAAMVLLSL